MPATFDVLADGLAFPEGPRWHDGALWFSDMHAEAVLRMAPGELPREVVRVPRAPSGLGFLPDGRLLVVSMRDRRVLRLETQGLREHADLGGVAHWHANDMLVDTAGRAYVGNLGDASPPGVPVTPANLALVLPNGEVKVAASDMALANGMALVDGGRILVVAETRAQPPRITTFARAGDGTLRDRSVLVELGDTMPDGICADAEDHLWVASPFTSEVVRIDPAGTVVRRVPTPQPAYACALGGTDGRTLFVCASDSWVPEEAHDARRGRILASTVDVPGQGLP